MIRRSLITALLAAALLSVAPAAHAKGPTSATIEGPGLTPAVRIDSYEPVGARPGMSDLMALTGADRVMFDQATRLAGDAPAAALGPRYTVSCRQPDEHGTQTLALSQDLYPFAAGGPLTYTPPGQRSMFTAATVASGWYRAPHKLTAVLSALGARAPLVSPSPATAQQPAGQSRNPAGPGTVAVLGWATASLIVAASVVLLLWRRRLAINRAGSAPA